MKKRVVNNKELKFLKEDFSDILGEHTEHLTILSTPQKGYLKYMGTEICEGSTISLRDVNNLTYQPESQNDKSVSFTFKNSALSDRSFIECIIDFSDSEMNFTSQTVKLNTYKDVAIYFDPAKLLGIGDNSLSQVKKACENGTLSHTEEVFVYRPNTKFQGKDLLEYQITQNDKVIDVLVEIEVQKPYDNLFFSNMINSPLHKAAIDFIRYSNAQLFTKTEDGFYFYKEQSLSAENAKEFIKKALINSKASQEVLEDGSDLITQAIIEYSDPLTNSLTAEDCVKIFQSFT